ncbi:MAG: hypothetical protein IKE43_04210 [Coriobacteriales bacterium]|nr:hypothetical protein [Coriobacteriales bacterium]
MTGCLFGKQPDQNQDFALEKQEQTFRKSRVLIPLGIELFTDQNGSTTIAAAVALMVSIALVFALATNEWITTQAADVQAVADAGALAGMNVVASYVTCAQVIDALVLSLGFIGLVVLAVGIVLSFIPVINSLAPPVLKAAQAVLNARTTLSKTAAKGLAAAEDALPYLIAANSLLVIRANATQASSYVGVAVPYPLESESNFDDLESLDITEKTDEALDYAGEHSELASRLDEFKQDADEALLKGWAADTGSDICMRERASTLAQLDDVLNPHYPTVTGWDFGVAILRARSYYAVRLAHEAPLGSQIDEIVRSRARAAFYDFALEQVNASTYTVAYDGTVTCDLHSLPRNTADVRATRLYTDTIWPLTSEANGTTLHACLECQGARGGLCGYGSLSQIDEGSVNECPVCHFTITDIGMAPSASTSIDNGFEYYWKVVVDASREYQTAKDNEEALERELREAEDNSKNLFKEALEKLSPTRVKLCPPGRYGCIAFVVAGGAQTPLDLQNVLSSEAQLPARVAIAGAVLARDSTSSSSNILAGFFDALVAQGGTSGAAMGILDAVMTGWGDLLVSYENSFDAFHAATQSAFEDLESLGFVGLSTWLRNALEDIITLTGLTPADTTAKKPVLTDTNSIMTQAGNEWYSILHAYVMSVQDLPPDASVSQILATLGQFFEEYSGSSIITIAEFEVPVLGTKIPLELDLKWLAELADAA